MIKSHNPYAKALDGLDLPNPVKSFFDFCIEREKIRKKREKGCTEPLYGKKSKCVIKIVPKDDRVKSFQMDKKCIKKR